MDDGSDRVGFNPKSEHGTRFVASLVFLAIALAVSFGAGCAKSQPPRAIGQTGSMPQTPPKEVVRTVDVSSDLQESLAKNCYLPSPGFKDKVYADDKAVSTEHFPLLSENFKRATKDGEFEVICYDSGSDAIYFSMATTSVAAIYSFPSDDLGRDGHVLGFWRRGSVGNIPGDTVIFSEPFKSRSTQELTKFYGLELSRDSYGDFAVKGVITGSVQNDVGNGDWSAKLVFHPGERRLELVSSTNTDQIDSQLMDEIDRMKVTESPDCLKSYSDAMPSEKLDAYLVHGLDAPPVSQAFLTAATGTRVQMICFNKKNSLVFFALLMPYEEDVGLKPVLRLPKGTDKGTGYRFGYWDTATGKVKISPVFTAQGMGDMALISKLRLVNAKGPVISGETGGGDGPCGWESTVVYAAATGAIKTEKYSQYCDTSDEEGQVFGR